MKNILSLSLAISLVLLACKDRTENQPDSEKYRSDDSGNHQGDGGYSPDTSLTRDTSSYQRMPNKVTDTTKQ